MFKFYCYFSTIDPPLHIFIHSSLWIPFIFSNDNFLFVFRRLPKRLCIISVPFPTVSDNLLERLFASSIFWYFLDFKAQILEKYISEANDHILLQNIVSLFPWCRPTRRLYKSSHHNSQSRDPGAMWHKMKFIRETRRVSKKKIDRDRWKKIEKVGGCNVCM